MSSATSTGDITIDWLLGGDPAISWQTQRDLLDAPASVWAPIRARVESEGWGAALLARRDLNGGWAGGAFLPADFGGKEEWRREGQPWTATSYVLTELRECGLDPNTPRARAMIDAIGEHVRWDHAGERFWDGESEECINGRALSDGAYFGAPIGPLAGRLIAAQLRDGGWNCESENGATVGSFASTINVLEGLLAYERIAPLAGGPDVATVRQARRGGEAYLLERELFRRRSNGQPADAAFLALSFPLRWRYDILRALDYFRHAAAVDGGAATPDRRLTPALRRLAMLADDDGRWSPASRLPGRVWFDMEPGPGQPSRWLTLRALRVLRWSVSS